MEPLTGIVGRLRVYRPMRHRFNQVEEETRQEGGVATHSRHMRMGEPVVSSTQIQRSRRDVRWR